MSHKFGKLQASLKKQAAELEFYDTEDFDIEVEGELAKKFKMPNLPISEGTEDPRAHLIVYLICMKTVQLKKE